jgi:inorganic triphosphatase YgiF
LPDPKRVEATPEILSAPLLLEDPAGARAHCDEFCAIGGGVSCEVEIKLEVAPEHADELPSHPLLRRLTPRVEALRSVYFDTRKGKLKRNGWTLRVREANGLYTQTLKRAGPGAGLFSRDEWEGAVAGPDPDPNAAAGTPIADFFGKKQFGRLVPLFAVEVERSTWVLRPDGAEVELVSDRGLVAAGDRTEDFNEIELELRAGDVSSLVGLAQRIGRRIPFRLGVQAKAERGFQLARGMPGRAVKAEPVTVGRRMTIADGVAIIISACLKHFRLNEALVVPGGDPEGLHQARVALRRLRAALSLFKPAIDDDQFDALRNELRAFTAKLGPARDLDVLIAKLQPRDRKRRGFERRRARHYAAIEKMFASRRFRAWTLDMVGWVYGGDWRETRRAKRPLLGFALGRLDRLWRAIERRGDEFDSLSDYQRHRLRIHGKKIRYGLEFLEAPLSVAGSDQQKFAKAVEGLQEALGEMNDLTTARTLVPWNRQAATADQEAEVKRLAQIARRHLRTLRDIGPYWRNSVRKGQRKGRPKPT